jgi:ABC-type metal ion transport system, periplasmic component/surface adhesin
MSKRVLFFLAAVLTAGILCGCGAKPAPPASSAAGGEERMQVVAVNFPCYDFARAVCGDAADVTMLLPPGVESHSYEPTPKDILKVQSCDLFVCVGGESEAWLDTILQSVDHPVRTLKMIDCVKPLAEETVEGMESHEEPEAGGTVDYDEHVWTAPANAVEITQAIGREMEALDAENASAYRANTAAYVSQLRQLDADFKSFFATVSNKTVIFGDRFPLRYFVEEYGLTYYAAFPGCSTQTEPSAATIAFLIDKLKAEHLSTVYYIEFSNHLVADSIAEAAGVQTAMIQTCHNVSQEEVDSGATYVSLMREDLETFRETMR